MESFLTPELQQTFNQISLDYTYKHAVHFFDRIKRGIASTSDRGHYEILLKLMNHEGIQYDGIAYEHLMNVDMFQAANRLAFLGDMIFHNIKSEKKLYHSILYCPQILSEYQILRLRLWYEFFSMINASFDISYQNGHASMEIKAENILSFLEKQQVLNDSYIHTLTKKYPDYKE